MKPPSVPSELWSVYKNATKAEIFEAMYALCAIHVHRELVMVEAINVRRRVHGKSAVHAEQWWDVDAQTAPGLVRTTLHVLARSAVAATRQIVQGGGTVYAVAPARSRDR